MESKPWIPEDTDVERPSSARIYDYWLGGAHNFEADRRVAEQMIAVVWVPQWHPDSADDIYHDQPEASGLYGGVARKV